MPPRKSVTVSKPSSLELELRTAITERKQDIDKAMQEIARQERNVVLLERALRKLECQPNPDDDAKLVTDLIERSRKDDKHDPH